MGVKTKLWGSAGWKTLHNLAKWRDSIVDKFERHIFHHVIQMLPCVHCRNSSLAFIKSPTNVFPNNCVFVHALHQHVNIKLMSQEIYAAALDGCVLETLEYWSGYQPVLEDIEYQSAEKSAFELVHFLYFAAMDYDAMDTNRIEGFRAFMHIIHEWYSIGFSEEYLSPSTHLRVHAVWRLETSFRHRYSMSSPVSMWHRMLLCTQSLVGC